MINFTPILEGVITLAVAVITIFIIPWLKKKIGAEKLADIQYWVTIGVKAAEKLYKESGKGKEKLAYVEDFMRSKGFDLDSKTLRALIEAAVENLTIELNK